MSVMLGLLDHSREPGESKAVSVQNVTNACNGFTVPVVGNHLLK